MARDIGKIVSEMTLEEKASLCSGLSFWQTKPVERLGVPSITMTDGPHGLRKQAGAAEHIGTAQSVPATCFPTAAGLACSWDRDLLEVVGRALGEECQAEDVQIILGPGANIKRSPLCGRNFEYFSEDPYLSSELAASHINGVQSQGVGTSLKHFVANNQEHKRMTVDAQIDERTLRELYLASFEGAVKQGKPWSVMAAYNRVNGDYCTAHKYLLSDILKEEWGFAGIVVSDWFAVDDRVAALAAGLDLEMPASGGVNDQRIVEAVKSGRLPEKLLNQAAERLLTVIFRAVEQRQARASYDPDAHHRLARQVARESMVLLKNDREVLPLSRQGKLAVMGAFAENPRYQGAGSSHINPTRVDIPLEEIRQLAGEAEVIYTPGYSLDSDEIDQKLIEEAVQQAKQADTVVIFAGLPDRYDAEGFDRTHLRIPQSHQKLIEEVSRVQSRVVVVLINGAPVEMTWLDQVAGVLEAYLGGQAAGGAIADLLFGEANPCGKLAETFPRKLAHNPSYINFPGEGDRVEYREGLFVGYRHYDAVETDPLFAFGYGLSYTKFDYLDIAVDKKELTDQEELQVRVRLKNSGDRSGKEIVQLYIRDVESSVIRPPKELKGFAKVALEPGQEKEVVFTLGKRAFAYYNTDLKDWHVEGGDFEVLVGKSSRQICLRELVTVKSTVAIKKKFTRNSALGDLMEHPAGAEIVRQVAQNFGVNPDERQEDVLGMDIQAMMSGFALRVLVMASGGKFTEQMLEGLLRQVNEE